MANNKTESRIGEVLFDYLRDMLFYPNKAHLDVGELPPEFQTHWEGLVFLAKCIQENREFMMAMSKGDLSVEPPSIDNPISGPTKNLHGSLRHMAWQTAQIAKGDYKQRLNFMGEFSRSFNLMVEQLEERTQKLEKAKIFAETKNEELSQIQDLFLILIQNTPEAVVLIDIEDNSEYVLNTSALNLKQNHPSIANVLLKELQVHARAECDRNSKWALNFPNPEAIAADLTGTPKILYYSIGSYPMTWKDRMAMAHIISDRTSETEKERELFHAAMTDLLTGAYNRRFAMDLLEEWCCKKMRFCVSMVDLDNLKYCNDVFGHNAGDTYLMTVYKYLKMLPPDSKVCRIGGDEFLLISDIAFAKEQDSRLEKLRKKMVTETQRNSGDFKRTFSYGSCDCDPDEGKTLSEIIDEADAKMYQYKQKNKIHM